MLALEEPETHLHPQAARTLWTHIRDLPGQKIVTTHSPYFVQHVPFRSLRLVRLTEQGTEVRWLPASFSATTIPFVDTLRTVVAGSGGALHYEEASETLTVKGALDQRNYRELLDCYRSHDRRSEIQDALKDLRFRSSLYIDDTELQSLETFARRMRGEIFFAERWMIVEGQADYLIVHALAHSMGYDLDEHGVSVIDAQNNGKPETFAVLARALGIPWLAVFDGDDAGKGYVERIGKRGFSNEELRRRCRTHGSGGLEAQLVTDGLGPELREILAELGEQNAHDFEEQALQARLGKYKTTYAATLAARLRADATLAERAPEEFRKAVRDLRGLHTHTHTHTHSQVPPFPPANPL